MSQKSSTGQRKGLTMLLLAGLAGLLVWLVSKAKGQPDSSSKPSQPSSKAGNYPAPLVSGIPPKLYEACQIEFIRSPYLRGTMQNWLAISKMETAGWTSGLFRNGNNPWGMGYALIRPKDQDGIIMAGKNDGSQSFNGAKYKDFRQAAHDIILWMDYNKFPKEVLTLAEHVHVMDEHGYFGLEPEFSYLNKVIAWLNKSVTPSNTASSLGPDWIPVNGGIAGGFMYQNKYTGEIKSGG